MWPHFFRRDAVTAGAWLTSGSESVLQTLQRAGFDYIGIDCQHTTTSVEEAAKLIVSHGRGGPALIVRVPDRSDAPIGRALDAGADGVIVPMIETPEQAAAAVAATRYAPQGTRSFGPIRADLGVDPDPIMGRAHCFVMIETRSALEQVEDICSVPGLAGVYIGPGDLSLALGMPPVGGFTTDQLDPAISRIKSACDANALVVGIHSIGGTSARRFAALGCQMITVGSDTGLLVDAAHRAIADVARARNSTSDLTAHPTHSPYS